MVSLTIDGIKVQVPENYSVLDAAREAGIHIPTLCYLKDVNAIGACRVCLVEQVGVPVLKAACVLPVAEGMEINTKSEKVLKARKISVELILSDHRKDCLTCIRNQNCELQALANELGIEDIRYPGATSKGDAKIDDMSYSVVRDQSKCVYCKRCVATCRNVQEIGAIGAVNRGFSSTISPVFERSLAQVPCVNCGQCITACPVGALYEKDSTAKVWAAINDPEKHVIVQPAPAVRVGIAEEFGAPIGTRATGKLAAALRRLGFDKVFDTDFAADLTILEEGTELLGRIKNGGVLPMITSCSPGWIKYIEHYYPEQLAHLSSCKSPHEMLGAVVKSYYAEKNNIDPKNIYVVSVMPCTAKKFECEREELGHNGMKDVDAVLTVRELARMIRQAGIYWDALPDEDFDPVLGESTGAAVIFGVTGGVMEAAIRTVADVLTGEDVEPVEYHAVRGLEGVKEATVNVAGMDVKVAVAHGTANAKKIMDMVKAGTADYHFIEVMCCPGGCVTGGGQPIVPSWKKNYINPKEARAAATYDEDESKVLRKSHKNPMITKLYEEYFGEPNSEKAHHLLHTHYVARPKYED